MHSERTVGCKGLGLLVLVYAVAPRNDLLDLTVFDFKFGKFHLCTSFLCPEVNWTQEGWFISLFFCG